MRKGMRYRERWVLYYDSDCGLCTRLVHWLSKIDLFRQITWTPYQILERPPRGLTWDDLNHAAYLETGKGRLHEGFYAFKMLTLKLLPLTPLAPLFWFPGVNLAGVPAYRWVARNRFRLPGCRMPAKRQA